MRIGLVSAKVGDPRSTVQDVVDEIRGCGCSHAGRAVTHSADVSDE